MRTPWLLALAICLVVTGCCDCVTSRYANLQEARDDDLFNRGWLPEILPESAMAIRTSIDLDLNTSEGEFTIAIEDFDVFIKQLSTVRKPYGRHANHIEKMQKKGYEPFNYTEELTWFFFCARESGHCTYMLPYSKRS